MSAFYDRQQDALSGYTGDYCTEAKARVPVCQAEADWIAAEHASDLARINRVVASRMADDKADMRARCTVNWPREFKRAAAPVLALQQQLSANGFDARTIDPVLISLREALIQINQEQSA